MLGVIGARASFAICFLLATLLCHGSNCFLVGIKVLGHFIVFHKLYCLSRSLCHGANSLMIYFSLPTLGSSKEKVVNDFIITQTLSVVKHRWTTRNLLGVDAAAVHDVLFYTHV